MLAKLQMNIKLKWMLLNLWTYMYKPSHHPSVSSSTNYYRFSSINYYRGFLLTDLLGIHTSEHTCYPNPNIHWPHNQHYITLPKYHSSSTESNHHTRPKELWAQMNPQPTLIAWVIMCPAKLPLRLETTFVVSTATSTAGCSWSASEAVLPAFDSGACYIVYM